MKINIDIPAMIARIMADHPQLVGSTGVYAIQDDHDSLIAHLGYAQGEFGQVALHALTLPGFIGHGCPGRIIKLDVAVCG